MKITSTFDLKDYDIIKKYLLPNRTFVHILSVFILLFSIFTNKILIGFIIGLLGVIVMETLLIITSKRVSNIMKERFRQSLNGKDKLEIELQFDEETFTSHSSNTNSELTLSYNDIKKLIITEKYTLLFTTANSLLIIETPKITENKIDEFLLSKNPMIRIK